jgi:hypothetical protein
MMFLLVMSSARRASITGLMIAVMSFVKLDHQPSHAALLMVSATSLKHVMELMLAAL